MIIKEVIREGIVILKDTATDLHTLALDGGDFIIKGRMHIGNGVWKVWNDKDEYLELIEA